MAHRITFLTSAIGAALLLPAFGQTTFSSDETSPYGPNTYRNNGVYATGESITFNDVAGKSGSPTYDITPDFKESILTLSDLSEVEVFDICAEMFVGTTGFSTYAVSEGFGPLTASQETAARALFSNALSEFVIARDSLANPEVVGVAIQIAYWEIVEDPVLTSNLSLDDLGAFPGDLSILGFASGYTGTTDAAIAQAEVYLANIRSGTWTDEGGYNYYYADATGEQDRLWITTGVIPEPSTALLGLLGGLLLLRRRR